MIVIKIMERDMIVTTTARVTSGSVNLPVKFHFKGDEWDDLVKTAVFIGSGQERDVALITDECAVPADVLAEAGGDLKIGVYGRLANGATVIPTIWGRVQYIYEGTEMSDPSPHDPEPDWTAQVQQAAATALTKATAVEEAAARGDFDGVSPEVTINSITHGHSVTITDREHPAGQSFDVLDGASAYEQAVAGGYTGTEAQFNAELAAFKDLSEQAASSATAAASSATAAAGSATAAAGSATDAAGSATQAASSETAAAGSASNAASSATSASGSATAAASSATAAAGSASDAATAKTAAEAAQTAAAASAADASDSADSAASSATAASGSATAAANSATAAAASAAAIEEYEHDAEAWAVGKRGGTDVESTDSTYHNNSKYYAAQAAADASTASSAASAASQSEQNAAASATSASQSETNAAASETAAAGSASTATTAATAASNSATAAANSATAAGDAKTAAETAQGKAEDAQEAAEQAQSDAETAAQSVSQSAAQISQNASDISDLKSAITHNNAVMLADSVPTNYVFELGAIAGGTGVESDSTIRARTTVFIPYLNDEYIVEVGSDYTCSVIYYDSNQAFMIGHWWFTGTYVVKGYSRAEIQNTKYIKIVIKRTDDGDIDINDLNVNVKIGRKVNAPRTYTVNPLGGADFSSLVDAIFVAEQHMDSTVYLQNGVYDMLSDLGSSYINSVDASNRGVYLKNRIRLVGSGDTLITCLYDGSRELTAKWLAIFNAGEYGFTLENLRLSGKNIRYVIHDERDSDEDCYVNKYINCRMVFDNTENAYSNAVQCIGGGLGLHGVIVIDGCYFNSINTQNVAFPAVSYHNSADVSSVNGQSLIFIRNSYFENNNTVRINYYGNSTKITQAQICNNSLGRDVLTGAETTDGSSPNVNISITKFDNIIRQDPVITAILGTLDSGFVSAERCMNLVNVSLMIQNVNVGTSWTDVAYISLPPTKNQLFTVYDHTNFEALEGYILAGTGHIYMRAKQALTNCSVRAGFSYSIA